MIECQPMHAVEYPRGALRIGHDGALVISAQKVTHWTATDYITAMLAAGCQLK
jgi:hypothetical protein